MPKPIKVLKGQDDNSANIAELLKQNNGEDIEVVFYSNKKLIDKSTSFYEICKEPTTKSGSDEQVSQIKDIMAQISGGFLPGHRTIYFQIRDKSPNAISMQPIQRKDSLLEYSQIRQRTKSQFVDEISASGINNLV